MKHQTSQILYSYWNDVRGTRAAPRRFDIEPSRISQILSETLILERGDYDTFRFRLAGTRICELFGIELRGVDLYALWDQEGDRITLERHVEAITRKCLIGEFTFEARLAGGDLAQFEMILLPLVHTNGAIDRCLGAISGAYTSLWRHQPPIAAARLTTARLLTPEADPANVVAIRPEVRSAKIIRFDRRQFRVYEGGLSKQPADE